MVVNSEETVEKEKLAPTSITPMERALLLALALKWRKEKENLTSEQIRDFEREIWLSHIRSAMEDMESPVSTNWQSVLRIHQEYFLFS